MVFVDNPVGVGFSFTQSSAGYATGENDVARNMYSLLTQLFQVFPEFLPCDFYVTGESYAGKYVPAIASYIDQQNKGTPQIRINLKGLSIGDGMMDPYTQATAYSGLLFQLGLASENEYNVIVDYETKIKTYITQNQLVDAFQVFDELINGDFTTYPTYYYNITGLSNYFNFLDPVYPPNPWEDYINKNSTRAAIHVGSIPFWSYNASVETQFIPDWMKSVASILPNLWDNYKVLVYNGQNDVILAAPPCETFLRTLQWSGATAYANAPKVIWKLKPTDTDPVGYARTANRFTYVVVRNAGHMLPQDQPDAAFDMISRFIDGRPFSQ
jgi:vitellogenic carboxypeptidase-like protein